MAANSILGFWDATSTGTGARANVTRMLRLLGIVTLAGCAVSILNRNVTFSPGTDAFAGMAIVGTAAIFSALFSIAITLAICSWITFTVSAWNSNAPRGATHALIIGIFATILGAFGVLGELVGGLIGTAILGPGQLMFSTIANGLSLIVQAAGCYAGIMILVNRGKALAGTESVGDRASS